MSTKKYRTKQEWMAEKIRKVRKPASQTYLQDRIKASQNPELMITVLGILTDMRDYEPYIFHVSKNFSVYIKFGREIKQSVRIGDHGKRSQYRYRYNIHLEKTERPLWKVRDEMTGLLEYHAHYTESARIVRLMKDLAGEGL